MKKFLLLACVAVATLAANAQEKSLAMPDMASTKSLVMTNPSIKPQKLEGNLANSKFSVKKFSPVAKNRVAKAAPSKMLANYIEDGTNSGLHYCDSVTVKSIEAVQDSAGNTYNVQVSFGLGGVIQDVYGNYDAAAGTLTIPSFQACYEDATYGTIVLAAFDNDQWADNLSFEIDEESGIFYMNEDGYMTVINDGDYAGYAFTPSMRGVSFLPKNGLMQVDLAGQSSWETIEMGVAITDDGYTLGIYNAYGYPAMYFGCYMEATYEGETASFACNQNLYSLTFLAGSDVDTDTYGEYYYLVAGVVKDSAVYKDRTATSIPAVKGEGEGYHYLYSDQYFLPSSKADADGASYGLWTYAPQFIWVDYDPTGISEIAAKKNRTTTSHIYNLAGQVVDKNYKGIVIKNGRKYVQK